MTPPPRVAAPVGPVAELAAAALAATRGFDDWEDEVRADAPAPVAVLADPGDDVAVTKALLDWHCPAAGRVTVHPTPFSAAPNTLAHDVLAALGRPVTRLSAEQISGAIPAWQAVAAWVGAEEITQVVVLRAHTLSAAGWARLLELRERTGIALVMVWHAPALHAPWGEHLAGVPYRETDDVGEICAVTAPAPLPPGQDDDLVDGGDGEPGDRLGGEDGRAPDAPSWDLPPLPGGDVASFRAEAFRQLPIQQFLQVDAAYQRGMAAACRWLSGHPEQNRVLHEMGELDHYLRRLFPDSVAADPAAAGAALLESRYPEHELRTLAAGLLCVGRGRDAHKFPSRFADEVGLQVFLGGLVAGAMSRRYAIALLRGAQAGAMLHGLLLALPSTLTRRGGPGLGAVPFGYESADRIRARIASPVHAAALATALFTGCHPTDLAAQVTIEALAEDAGLFAVPGPGGRDGIRTAVFVVPDPARPLLAAARTFLRLRGTPPHRKLLYPGIGKDGEILTASAEAAGLPLPVSDEGLSQCWTAATTAWWIGTHLHHPGSTPGGGHR
ncbi:hypothetical protein [Amycolatopsis sp. lyj-23]|uniref:hypothetical protein n=1 Tax=Amycolatopsis sp. lyj-23 TaxID=2789283 RepID=UPI00397A276F